MIYNDNRLWKLLIDKGAAMTTGKRSLKECVARIANARKMSVTLAGFVLLFVAAAVGCTYSGAAKAGPESAAEASARVPQDAELRIIDPYSSAERSVLITETEDVQALFHICETARSNAGLMSGNYTLSYGAPVYTVHFLFSPTGPGPDYIPAHESFQMWSGGQFMLFDETDPVNGTPLVWYDADNTEYEELFESLYEKYGAGLLPADVPLALSMEAVVYADGEIMYFADGSEIRLHDAYITSEDISFSVDAGLTSAPAISAVMLDGNIISAAPAAITESESGGAYCYALWEEPISLSETAYIACFGGAFGVNGFSVSHVVGKWPEPEVAVESPKVEAASASDAEGLPAAYSFLIFDPDSGEVHTEIAAYHGELQDLYALYSELKTLAHLPVESDVLPESERSYIVHFYASNSFTQNEDYTGFQMWEDGTFLVFDEDGSGNAAGIYESREYAARLIDILGEYHSEIMEAVLTEPEPLAESVQ